MKHQLITLTLLSASLSLACQSSFSGLDPNKKGSELDADEVIQLCEAGAGYGFDTLADNLETYCNTLGVGDAAGQIATGATEDSELQAACKTSYDECMVLYEDATSSENFESNREKALISSCEDAEEVPDCESTVGEIEACSQDTVSSTLEYAKKLPECEDLTLGKLIDIASNPPESPDSCEPVAMDCPDAMEFIGF